MVNFIRTKLWTIHPKPGVFEFQDFVERKGVIDYMPHPPLSYFLVTNPENQGLPHHRHSLVPPEEACNILAVIMQHKLQKEQMGNSGLEASPFYISI